MDLDCQLKREQLAFVLKLILSFYHLTAQRDDQLRKLEEAAVKAAAAAASEVSEGIPPEVPDHIKQLFDQESAAEENAKAENKSKPQ